MTADTKGAEPTEPGWYWVRTTNGWRPVENRGDGFAWIGPQTVMFRGDVKGWGSRIPEPGAAPAEPDYTLTRERLYREVCEQLEREASRVRAACDRLRAISGKPNDGPKDLEDYVSDVEGAIAEARAEVERATRDRDSAYQHSQAAFAALRGRDERVRELEAALRMVDEHCKSYGYDPVPQGICDAIDAALANTPAPAEPTPPSSGAEPETEYRICRRCDGTGTSHDIEGQHIECPKCDGTGGEAITGAPTGATPEDRTKPPPGWELSDHAPPGPALVFHRPTGYRVHLADAWTIYERDRVTADATAELRAERDGWKRAHRITLDFVEAVSKQRDSLKAERAALASKLAEAERLVEEAEAGLAGCQRSRDSYRKMFESAEQSAKQARSQAEALQSELDDLRAQRQERHGA